MKRLIFALIGVIFLTGCDDRLTGIGQVVEKIASPKYLPGLYVSSSFGDVQFVGISSTTEGKSFVVIVKGENQGGKTRFLAYAVGKPFWDAININDKVVAISGRLQKFEPLK